MPEELVRVNYSLTAEAPFHSGTGSSEGLVNRTVMKDAEGFPYIPASTLKGLARFRTSQICRTWRIEACGLPYQENRCFGSEFPCLVCALFGTASRGERLFFSDAVLPEETKKLFQVEGDPRHFGLTVTRTQIKLSRATGLAQEGHLFRSEYVRSGLVLTASVTGRIRSNPVKEEILIYPEILLFLCGLKLVDRIGGGRSRGFGRMSVQIDSLNVGGREIDLKRQFGFLERAVAVLREGGGNL